MVELAPLELCTGCGACAYACPKACIRMKENEIGVVFPVVDDTGCVNCKRCQKSCPVLEPIAYNMPQKAYAAWSSDKEECRTSTSGGVAAEIYKMALENGMHAAGAVQNDDFSVTLSLTDRKEHLAAFKNSKYVFSSAYELFPRLKELLAYRKQAVVIGLPCQIAAIRKLFGENNPDLLLADLVCHGVPLITICFNIFINWKQRPGKQRITCRSGIRTLTLSLYITTRNNDFTQSVLKMAMHINLIIIAPFLTGKTVSIANSLAAKEFRI